MIRVLIADDHGIIRDGLSELVSTFDDVEVVGTAADGEEALRLAQSLGPDVVLMDLEMPVMDGAEATRRIVAAMPGTAVVILTSFSDRRRILGALESGALGYMLKDAAAEELERGIRTAAEGGSPLDPTAARALISARTAPDPLAGLSEREREVLTLVAKGYANKEIARRLEISEKTVKGHLTKVFRQIGVTDRTQAALWAEREGLTAG
jgi:DNA-binding NarL/FixJ family response regulator